MKFKRLSKALLLTFFDLLRQNYLYHSGALTYHFMLSIAPLTIVLIHLISFLPFFEISRVEPFLDRLFPQYTSRVIHEIIQVQQKGTQTSFLALGVSYVFSVGFLRNLSKAFSYVSEDLLGGKREVFYWFLMPLLMIALVLIISLSFFLSVYIKLVLPKSLSTFADLFYILPGALVILTLYVSFLKRKVNPVALVLTSLLVSLGMFILQSAFTWYVAKVFKGSLIYGSLSTVVAFLLWINLIFLSLLLGARLIYRFENS